MKKNDMIKRLVECRDILTRAGVKDINETITELDGLDGPGVSGRVKWMKAVERACIDEANVFKDQSPVAWRNLAYMQPHAPELKRLRALRAVIRKAWISR